MIGFKIFVGIRFLIVKMNEHETIVRNCYKVIFVGPHLPMGP